MNSQIEEILKGISKSRNKDNLEKMFYPDVDISDYFFISYSHKDYRAVYKDLVKLRENNLKIWYDRDVPAGTNWKEVVNRYMRPLLCKGVIFYVSENSLRDKETTKQTLAELEYAKQIGKPIIAINLTTRVTVGDHRKDVVLSATDMIDELIKEGRHDLVAHKKEIENVFPRDVIYLPITLNPSIRAKKITDALQEAPKVIIGDLFTIDRISDSTVINVTEADFQKSLIASKLVDRDGTASFKDLHLNIEACAFSNCQSLETVSFSSPTLVVSIESIGEYAFSNCDSLKEIDFANSLITTLGAGVFYDCKKLEKLDGVFKLTEPKTFYNCESLTKLEVTSDSIFDDFCFYSCLRLKELENTGASSFVGIEQPKRKHRIGFKAFCNCQSLTMLPITQSVEEIDDYAFSYCTSLKWVYLGPNIKRVGDGAFENCVSLKTIRIDSPKLDIDFKRAFLNSKKIEEVIITDKNKQYKVIDGAVYKDNTLVFYPSECKKEVLTISDKCIAIGDKAILFNNHLKEIKFGKNVKEISTSFAGIYKLEKITVDKENQHFASVNGLLFDKKLTKLLYIPAKAAKKIVIVPDSVIDVDPDVYIDAPNTEKVVRKSEIK